jgi:SOS response regulatory protein OraA/RecX
MAGDARVPVVTGLRARGPDRVEIALDGRPWRVVPTEAVFAVHLSVGRAVDRETARALGRELRRLRSQALALRALRTRDHTVASLERRLTERGAAPAARRDTLEAVQRAGLVDDTRFARERAGVLAERGAGNALIVDDLERNGVAEEEIRVALEGLEPESDRAARIIGSRGRTPKTARHLASKGFSEETLEALVADLSADAID